MDGRGARFQAWPDHLPGQPMASPPAGIRGRLEAEAEARWRVVTQQTNSPWGWMAMDQQPRPILVFHIGERRRERATPPRAER